MYELIPDELKRHSHWVCWKAVPDPKSHSGIKKQPIDPKTGHFAKSNDPSTWSDFVTAEAVSGDYAGIGFMFEGSGYFGVDIDDTELDSDIVREFCDTLKSYSEVSYSGNGIHIICRGKLPEGSRRKGKIEMYDSGRYFVMTGTPFGGFIDLADGTETIKALHAKYLGSSKNTAKSAPDTVQSVTDMDTQSIIQKACNSRDGGKFRRLLSGDISGYNSQSEADMSFCNMLAFWCGGDIEKMDSIYRSSGLMREKWDRKQSGSTYGKLTMEKAVKSCQAFYDPHHGGSKRLSSNSFPVTIQQSGAAADIEQNKMYKFDDTGNAERMLDSFGETLKWSYVEKKWLYYLNGKWHYDDIGYHRRAADAVAESIEQDYPLYQGDEEMEKAFNKHLKKTRSYTGKTNMIKEYEHLSPILPKMLDKHKMLLNVKNGIVDLKTGQLLPHDRKAYLTKQIPVNYDPNAPEPELWQKFLSDIFAGDNYLIHYIKKCCGYSICGSTEEQCMFFLHGSGGNGKSVFLEIIRFILGDYATNIQPQSIMLSPKSGNGPSGDIARLKGARLVTSVEPNEGAWLDEGLVKQLTGDDVVTARKMFSEEFEFKPEFKLWIATNHKPRIKGTDNGIWRRIHLIPFSVQIPADKVDKHLKYKLVKEAESILKWMIDGFTLWKNEGLVMPKAVLDATEEYRHEMDTLTAFLEACCVIGEGEIKASSLYTVYSKWADDNNEYKLSNTKFGREMVKRFEKVKTKNGLVYKGLVLAGE